MRSLASQEKLNPGGNKTLSPAYLYGRIVKTINRL